MRFSLTTFTPHNRWDDAGRFASGLCAVHCALCALIPSVFTLLNLEILLDHEAEWTFTTLAIIFALGAALVGWINHKNKLITTLFMLSIVSLLGSRLLEETGGHGLGAAVGVAAGILLFITHFKNSSAIKASRAECCDT